MYFQFQRILITKISNYKWSKRDVQNYIFLITILKHIKLPMYELANLYTVPLSTINGLSHLTKLTTNKGAKIFKLSNPFRIESDGRFEFESNLQASQVPNLVCLFWHICIHVLGFEAVRVRILWAHDGSERQL